jgi:hypothetical protein
LMTTHSSHCSLNKKIFQYSEPVLT